MPRSEPRLFTDNPLGPEILVKLDKGQAHYIAHVMRLRAGDQLTLFNGRDGEWLASVATVSKKGCTVRIESRLRLQEPAPDLWLAFAPVKKDGTGFIVEKATELGVSRLCPVFTKFTMSRRFNSERHIVSAIEASEQCGRLDVPVIDNPVPLEDLLANWPEHRSLWVADENGAGLPIADALDRLDWPDNVGTRPHGFLIGPEGGLADDEREQIQGYEFITLIDLGPRILRAETAAVSVLACWQALTGDWRGLSQP